MNQRLLIASALCTILFMGESLAWPPRNFDGIWRVTHVSFDTPLVETFDDTIFRVTDDMNLKHTELAEPELLIISADYFALVYGDPELPVVHGIQLSDGVADEVGYRAKYHIPAVTVDKDGARTGGTAKESITFKFDARSIQQHLNVMMHALENKLNIRAERIENEEASARLRTLLAHPNLHCSKEMRSLLQVQFANDGTSPQE